MEQTEIACLDQLIASGLQQRLSVFAGAGISFDSPTNLPLAKPLTSTLVSQLCQDAMLSGPDQAVLTFCVERIRLERLFSILWDILDEEAYTPLRFFAKAGPNRNHLVLAELALHQCLAAIITTNFDSAIECALTKTGVSYRLLVREEEFAQWDGASEPLPVLKLHGSLNSSSGEEAGLIVLMEQVGKPLTPAKAQVFERLVETTDFLFVGYSGRDDFDIYPILYNTRSSASLVWVSHPQSAPTHPRQREGIENLTFKDFAAVFAMAGSGQEGAANHIERLIERRFPGRAIHLQTNTSAFMNELAYQLTYFDFDQPRFSPEKPQRPTTWESDIAAWAQRYQGTAVPYLVKGCIQAAESGHETISIQNLEMALETARRSGNLRHEAQALIYLGAQQQKQKETGKATANFVRALSRAEEKQWPGLIATAKSYLAEEGMDTIEKLEKALQQQRANGDVVRMGQTLLDLGLAQMEAKHWELAVDALVESIAIRSRTHEVPRDRQKFVRDTPNELREPVVAQAMGYLVLILTRREGWQFTAKALNALSKSGFDEDASRYLSASVMVNELSTFAEKSPDHLDESTCEWLRWIIEIVCGTQAPEMPAEEYFALKRQEQEFARSLIDGTQQPVHAVLQALHNAEKVRPQLAIDFCVAWLESRIPARLWIAAMWLGESNFQLNKRLDMLTILAGDDHPAVQESAAYSMGQLAISFPEEVLVRVNNLVRHKNSQVRMNAALVLKNMHGPGRHEAIELLTGLAADESKLVQKIAKNIKKRLRGSLLRLMIDFVQKLIYFDNSKKLDTKSCARK